MKKWTIPISVGAILILLLLVCFIPNAMIQAKTEKEFDISGTILMKYTGGGDTCNIPGNITRIGPGAFQNSNLNTLTIPSNVTTVDENAFYGCKKLSRVYVEEGVENIGVSAFSMCENLNTVVLPSTVKKIGAGIFSGCTSLAALELSASNPYYFYNDGVLYNKDSSLLVAYLPGRSKSYYEMPYTVNRINPYSFWGCKNVRNIRVSNQVTEIPSHAFTNCVSLENIYLPDGVKYIQPAAFSNCENLKYIATENKAVRTSEDAFDHCSDDLIVENGVDETSAVENSDYKTDAVSDSVSNGGDDEAVVRNHEHTFVKPLDQPVIIENGGKGEIGNGRVSGGNVLIIPEKLK